MKLFYILFLFLLSLAELIFTGVYYFLTGRFDGVPLAGLALYAGCMVTVISSYQVEKYQAERRELLEGLLS
jgi:hypothetical protein